MLMYDIPDIRLFWVNHPRFLSQFSKDKTTSFVPYTLLDSTYRDISFWIPSSEISGTAWTAENDFMALIRDVAGERVKEVKMFDRFTHPKTGNTYRAYRIIYEETDPDVTDPAAFTANVNTIQQQVIAAMTVSYPQWKIR